MIQILIDADESTQMINLDKFNLELISLANHEEKIIDLEKNNMDREIQIKI